MLRTGRAVALGCRWMSSGSASSKPTSSLDGFMFPGPRALKHIAKLPLLEKEPVEKVDAIWREYHNAHKTAVSDVLSASQYNVLMQRSQRCPYFVLPVRGEGKGYYMVFTQWQDKHCLMTYLEDYKRLGASASPYMIVTLFPELLKEKEIALVRGEVFTDKLQKADAMKLLTNLKKFYLGEEKNYEELIKFNERPTTFKISEVLNIC